jgi:hypothetical protein
MTQRRKSLEHDTVLVAKLEQLPFLGDMDGILHEAQGTLFVHFSLQCLHQCEHDPGGVYQTTGTHCPIPRLT